MILPGGLQILVIASFHWMNCNWRKCGWESFCDRGSNLLTSRIPERGTFDARRVCLKLPKIKLLYLMSLWPRRNATSYQPRSISAFTIAEKKLTRFRPRRDSKPCLPNTVGALLATELRSHTLITRQIQDGCSLRRGIYLITSFYHT